MHQIFLFPTHLHDASIWEALGRTVATFGMLEKTLGKASFAFTGTKPYSEEEIEQALTKWLPQLERAISDPLGALIGEYVRAVKAHPDATITNIDDPGADFREASRIRNVLCHGSCGGADANGMSKLFLHGEEDQAEVR